MSEPHRRPLLRLRAGAQAAVVCLAVLGWPIAAVLHPVAALVAAPLLAAAFVALAGRRSQRVSVEALAGFAVLAGMEIWREADHSAAAAFAVLAALPVVWAALRGARRQMWLTVAAATSLVWTPVFVARDRYPMSDARSATLCVISLAVIGSLIVSVVTRSRAAACAEPRLAALLRADTQHAVIATDPDGRITLFSAGAEQMLAWTAEEMLGVCPVYVFFDADEILVEAGRLQVAPGFAVVAHPAQGRGGNTREWTFVTKDRIRKIVSLSLTAEHDADGRLVGYFGIGTDVTDARIAVRRGGGSEIETFPSSGRAFISAV